jgi:DNA modification methylase
MANRTGNNLHPTEKPVKLIRELIKANKGKVVFDPFMGSGTTMVACKQLERDFIGIEIDEAYCKIANQRLEQSPITTLFASHDKDSVKEVSK